MTHDVLDDIRLLRMGLERWGLRKFSTNLLADTGDPAQKGEQLLRQCWEEAEGDSSQPPRTTDGDEQPNYVVYGMLQVCLDQWQGTTPWQGVDRDVKSSRHQPPGPLSVVFNTVFINILKQMKQLVVQKRPEQFQRAVRHFTTVISRMFTGAYGSEFYQDLEVEDLKLMVFLLRTLLSMFLDTQVDCLYPDGALPVRTVFVWARCIVQVFNMISGLRPQYLSGFEHDLITDFRDVVQLPDGTTLCLFRRAMKSLQLVGVGIEMKNPTVTVNDNTLRILAIVISEFVYNNRMPHSVSVDGNSWDVFRDHTLMSTGTVSQTCYPLQALSHTVAAYLLDHSLRPLSAVVSDEQSMAHCVALWHAYIYLRMGYCDFACKKDFVRRIVGDNGDGGHNSNALLELIDTHPDTYNGPVMYTENEYVAMLRAMRLMQEIVVHLLTELAEECTRPRPRLRKANSGYAVNHESTDTSNARWLRITVRTLFVWHVYYYKMKIQRVGTHAHDVDYYTSFFKMAAVTLHRFRSQTPAETADALTSVTVMSLSVLSRSRGLDGIYQVVPHVLLRPTTVGVNGSSPKNQAIRRESDTSGHKDALLRVGAFAYTNMKAIVESYIGWTSRPYDIMKAVYTELQEAGHKFTSLLDVAETPIAALLKTYSKYNHLRTLEFGTPELLSHYSSERSGNSDGYSGTPRKAGAAKYGFSKCFEVSVEDETIVAMVCLGAEAAIRLFLTHDSMNTKETALAFVILNTLVLLLLQLHQRLLAGNGDGGGGSRGSTALVLLETYLHLQTVGISHDMRAAIRSFLMSTFTVGDAVVEVLICMHIGSTSSSPPLPTDQGGKKGDIECPGSRREWLIVIACLRCVTTSPIKDVLYVINTLTLLADLNANGGVTMASGATHSASGELLFTNTNSKESQLTLSTTAKNDDGLGGTLGSGTAPTNYSKEHSSVVEKFLIHALTRYFASVAVNAKRLQANTNDWARLNARFVDGVFGATFKFLSVANIADVTYDVVNIVPFMLKLWHILRSEPPSDNPDLVEYCMALQALNRRRHSVAHTIPLLSDSRRLLNLMRRAVGPPKAGDTGDIDMTGQPDDTAVNSARAFTETSSEPGSNRRRRNSLSAASEPSNKTNRQFSPYSTCLEPINLNWSGDFSISKDTSSTSVDRDEDPGVVPYSRYIELCAARLPRFCFHCKRMLRSDGMRRGLYHVICSRCGRPSPLLCEGHIDSNNTSYGLYVSSAEPFTTRVTTEGGMLALDFSRNSEGSVDLEWDTIASLLVRGTRKMAIECATAEVTNAVSTGISDALAFYMVSAPVACQGVLKVTSTLPAVGPCFVLLMMYKTQIYNKLGKLPVDGFYTEFFRTRFVDNMVIMSDASADVEHLQVQYFCDLFAMSMASNSSRPEAETACMDFWHKVPSLVANIGATSLSQIVTSLLQEIVDAELKFALPHMSIDAADDAAECLFTGYMADEMEDSDGKSAFAVAWVALSQVANVMSIPLTKLFVSGLSLTPVRLALTVRSRLTPVQPLAKALLSTVMSASILDRLEDIHEGTMPGVLCTDVTLNFTLDNCDYRLFQIMQLLNEGGQPRENAEQLRRLDKYRFYAMVRLLWYVTNPHVVLRMKFSRGTKTLLSAQTDYVAAPFSVCLEITRDYKRQLVKQLRAKSTVTSTQATDTSTRQDSIGKSSTAVSAADVKSVPPSNDTSQHLRLELAAIDTQNLESIQNIPQIDTENPELLQQSDGMGLYGALESGRRYSEGGAMTEYMRENFVRILEYFVAVWLNRGQHSHNFALKNKRVFYPEIYGYSDRQEVAKAHVARTYNCIAILVSIYNGDIDAFCDRMIEVLTIYQPDADNGRELLVCWDAVARKLSCDVLGPYAPGIAYYMARIAIIGSDGSEDGISADCTASTEPNYTVPTPEVLPSRNAISAIKMRLMDVEHGERFCAYIDCLVDCVSRPQDLDGIEKKLEMLASMVYSDTEIKVPYITREAAAITANQLLELNPFIFNIEKAKKAASKLAVAALHTIAEHSDDFAKNPTALDSACCSILGYVPCDLNKFRSPRQPFAAGMQCFLSDPSELAAQLLKDYLIPNMHLQVALYCIQEILKLLGLYKGGVRSQAELEEMGERWNRTFEPLTRRAIEPYRATSFLRNRAIEGVIETRLDVNTVLDIKSFVWWLLKMLPDSCPTLPLFRACDLAMIKIPSVLTFLLPYIVDSCVQFLDDEQCASIGKRMASLLCNILKRDSATFGINWQPPYEVLSRSVMALDSTDQYTSCQAIFNLIDGIKVLTDRYRKDLIAMRGSSSSGHLKRRKSTQTADQEHSTYNRNTMGSADDSCGSLYGIGSERDASETVRILITKMKRLESILHAVPELLVAHAAISCGSYARGVMIIEKKLTYEPLSYNFGNPGQALSNHAIYSKVENIGLNPQAIISLLCRGYLGLGDFDSLVCISSIVLHDDSIRSERKTVRKDPASAVNCRIAHHSDSPFVNAHAAAGDDAKALTSHTTKLVETRKGSISKRQRDVCRAFSYECRGEYREACDVYNRLLKFSQDTRLWTSWYRIIQMTGPSAFIQLPKLPELEESADSLIAESLTACWKLSLWDELDELLEAKRTHETELLEIKAEELSSIDVLLVDRSADRKEARGSQLTQCTVDDRREADVFWESLLMRDPIDVWFMEQTANAMSLLHKRDYVESERTIQEGFKHLIRPLGLAIRESSLVAMKYLEKIAIFNSLRLSSRLSAGKYTLDEVSFARELLSLNQGSAEHSIRNVINILGSAKVALELGDKCDAAAELLVSLNRTCRLNKVDMHIPGSMSLDDEALAGRSDVVLEHALTLHHKGHVDDAIASLKHLAQNDFEGFYNLVKMYSESNLLIPKRAISYMKEILDAAPLSFKANLLYAEYLDRLLDHRLRNAHNFRLVLDDSSICTRRSTLHSSVENTYIITGVEGIPGVFTFVQLVSATVNAYLQALAFVCPKRHEEGTSPGGVSRGSAPGTPENDRIRCLNKAECGDVCKCDLNLDADEASNKEDEGNAGDSSFPGDNKKTAGSVQDSGEHMDIVDILTKVIAIMCFYCTPNTTQFLSTVTFESEACQIFANAIMEKFFTYTDAVPQYYWYAVISQLMSRCHHKFLGGLIFQTLVARLVARYPKMALWSTLYFAHSVNPRMRQIHANIERKARELVPESALVVEYHHSIFKELSKVAMDTTVSVNDKSALRFQSMWRVLNSAGCRENAIIPTIENLSFDHIIHYDIMEAKSRLCGLDESMQVLRSKQKPKKIGFYTVSGQVVHFLVKNEVKGDLRKDKRMMEVTHGMPLQCYSVVSLTEVAGIIEWVPNMATMRALVTDEFRRVTGATDRDHKGDISKYAASITAKNYGDSLTLFKRLCQRRPPVLHRAYYKVFKRDPATWFCARKEFIHTCAVWSILGYIVGLGDRHAENILLNLITGQVMHVDFDCLFGKGWLLAVPELVPFRMTQNVVCNLGVCGTATDGPFYSEALKFLQMLQQDRHKITAILMSFVFDPLIEWHRGEATPNPDSDSQKVLQCIESKLRGALNVVLPSVEISSSLSARGNAEDAGDPQSLKSFENVAEIMEPRQQLQQLIQVATSQTHLSKMFVGWAPWM
ncbi:FATC domain-containing protein [Babesia ovata]|uniref:Serine/threonine-protein kinase ATR n=1 Tax=Babesia ovata TaxID=189622 RepID=A0A2H6KA31_9APIC|nr:FATC domain-containing protein [Babesia ovata]GBE59843.1 FATC domain-containing protein [Babesia ovata]